MKLDSPPSAENWTRMQYPDVRKTSNSLYAFMRGRPSFTYEGFRRVAKYRIEDRICLEDGLKINRGFGSELGKPHNADAIKAFFRHEAGHPIDGVPAFQDVIESYPLSRTSRIPIKPLAVIRESGKFVPILTIPWSQWVFDDFQGSLFITILERSLFTLTDFEDSDAKILFFPRLGLDKTAERTPILWNRDQFPVLSSSDFADQIKIYHEGRLDAIRRYREFKDQDG